VAAPTSTPARITVTRSGEDDARQRQVHLVLDAKPWDALAYGDSATREIAPGRHTLRADNTLFRKTAEFEAAPAEHVRFTTSNREGPGTWLFMMLGAPLLYLRLSREPPGQD
jgi:hypothetical protein